jgi:hypothetical protein
LDAPDTVGVVSLFGIHSSAEERRRVIDDIERLEHLGLGEVELASVLDSLGCCYDAPGEGSTVTKWIDRVHNLLQAKF